MLNSATADADDEKTSDIFGKTLKQFHQLPGVSDKTDPPLIFWLLAGYFRN